MPNARGHTPPPPTEKMSIGLISKLHANLYPGQIIRPVGQWTYLRSESEKLVNVSSKTGQNFSTNFDTYTNLDHK